MAEDENTSSVSGGGGGGGGGRSWKKLKPKKVPQRGLGVAQLEKIISEKQQKKDGTVFTQNSNISSTNSSSKLVIFESNPPTWPPPHNLMMQRSQHLKQPCSLSMVNASGGTSSSVLNLQMEPPSNQSFCGQEKMVGMKRPYPLSFEIAPIPSFHRQFPSASCSNGGTISRESAHPSFREHPSSSGAISDAITKKFIDENRVQTRDFLKVAPPQASQSNSSSLQPQNGQSEDPSHLFRRGGSNRPPFLRFFPPARTPMGQLGDRNGEAGESVDLNLKL